MKTEQAIHLYQANWDQMAGSILAVVTVKTDGAETAEELAWEDVYKRQVWIWSS